MEDRLHIDLDVSVHDGEVEGCAARSGQPGHEFSGWVGLLAALDTLIGPSGDES
jgi:hypothetical protein